MVLAVAYFSSQAKGEDRIPQDVIAKALSYIGYHLDDIFNAFLSKGIFPESWKKAHLVPLNPFRHRSHYRGYEFYFIFSSLHL